MASAWGSGWGVAWGSSWGSTLASVQREQLGGRGRQEEEDLILRVLDKWETIEALREAAIPAKQAVEEIVSVAPEKVRRQVQRIVRKYTAPKAQTDWSALQASTRDTQKLLSLWRETQRVHDDDEEIIMSESF